MKRLGEPRALGASFTFEDDERSTTVGLTETPNIALVLAETEQRRKPVPRITTRLENKLYADAIQAELARLEGPTLWVGVDRSPRIKLASIEPPRREVLYDFAAEAAANGLQDEQGLCIVCESPACPYSRRSRG